MAPMSVDPLVSLKADLLEILSVSSLGKKSVVVTE
jgi:hypothetical protein